MRTLSPRMQGTVVKWNDEKALGRIRPDDATDDIVLHLRDWESLEEDPHVGERVEFSIERPHNRLRPMARSVCSIINRQ
ncbi:cold shock domain-containing protein [Bradyrhizobium elkanii]|uniref:cold-shock protein n=1 Tax=Bradyrhizobium TaxID=374 RepID=UPI00271211FB|nr:cold shock domain-containing protein [Bradyrhizobium elkanii]WLA39474.1 cold shock domain-containing protein [Bradyrhizobium elkanii]